MSHGMTVYGAVPNAMEMINSMGVAIAKSRLLGCENEDQGRVMAMACLAKGTDPMSLAQRYDIIQGKLSMKADAMLATFRAMGGDHGVIQRDAEAAEVELVWEGRTSRFRFTWEEAQAEPFVYGKGGKIKDNYATPRKRMQMLWARVVSDGVRAICPEVNQGLYTPEEVSDFDDTDRGSIVTEPAPVNPVVAAVREAAGVAKPAAQPTEKPAEVETETLATGEQISRLTELFTQLKIDPARQLAAIQKRGAVDMSSLTEAGAADMIAALEKKLEPAAEPTAAESQTSQEPTAEPAAKEPPKLATAEQVDQVRSLLRSVSQKEGMATVGQQVKEKMGRCGITKLAEMTEANVQLLIDSLGREDLGPFLAASLESPLAPF
jgi:hypothetical protein